MKILQLHVDYVEYEPIQPEAKIYEEVEKRRYRIEDALLLLTCVEEDDDPSLAQRVVDDAIEFLEKLKIDKLVIYPYAHLSVKLASPSKAIEILKKIGEEAERRGIEIHRAPFGWNKKLIIAVKGHPLAEQLRSYGPEVKAEEEVPKALLAEEKIKSYWYILTPEGEMIPVDE